MKHLVLTDIDRTVLESYKVVLDGLSAYLGSGYELILHSLESLEHSVVKIVNGHYTGRTEGSPITAYALEYLDYAKTLQTPAAKCYFNKKNGKTLKSVTIPIQGENRRIIGLLCINFHTEISFSEFFSAFIPPQVNEFQVSETFSSRTEDLIADSVASARTTVYADNSIPVTVKNKEIIRRLYTKGIFNMKEAVVQVADLLGISKNTVYLHLRNIENN